MVIRRTALVLLISMCFASLSIYAAGLSEQQVLQDKSDMISANQSADIIVNESKVIRPADRELLGLDCEYEFVYGITQEPDYTELTDDFKEIAKDFYTVPVSRSGGSPSQTYKWRNLLGPFKDRKSSLNPVWNSSLPPQPYGPVEWIKSMQLINPKAKFIVDFNMFDTPQENAEYAQFLCAPADSKWGMMRAQYGIPDPVNVMAFELGNELDFGHSLDNDMTSATDRMIKLWGGDPKNYKGYLDLYCKRAQATIDAVRKVLPDAKFSVPGKTAPFAIYEPSYHQDTSDNFVNSMYWRFWTIGVIKNLGKDLDYMSLHMYYSGFSMPTLNRFTNRFRQDVDDTLPDNKIKFLITEHATWPSGGDSVSPDPKALRGSLRTAEFLNYMYKRPDIGAMTYFNFMGLNSWGMMEYIGGKLYLTGPERVYKAYDNALGDRIVESDVKSDSALAQSDNDKVAFTALASVKGKRELNLILVNCSPSVTFDLNFKFENQYTLKEETVFTAPNIESYTMSENTKNIFSIVTTQKDEAGFATYKMPNKSLVILKLESNVDISGSADIGLNSNGDDSPVKSVFCDTSDSWADAAINKMASFGLVKGVTEDTFEPQSLVTRAQFAAMLSRTLSLKTDGYTKSFFDDVDSNAWYSGDVNAVFSEGFLRGSSDKVFDPDLNITMEQLVTAAVRTYNAYKPDNKTVDVNMILKDFKYKDSISDWAIESVAHAVQNGLLKNLYENGNFKPDMYATRADAAAILYRLYNMIGAKRN